MQVAYFQVGLILKSCNTPFNTAALVMYENPFEVKFERVRPLYDLLLGENCTNLTNKLQGPNSPASFYQTLFIVF